MDRRLLVVGFALMAVTLAHAIFALLAFFRTRSRNRARELTGVLAIVSGGFSASMGFTYLSAYYGYSYDLSYRMAWIGYLALPAFVEIVHMHHTSIARWRIWLNRFFLVSWSCIYLLTITTHLIDRAPTSLIPYIKNEAPFDLPIRIFAGLGATWLLIELLRARNNSVAIRRHRSNFFLLGSSFYAVACILFAGGLQNITKIAFDPGLVAFFSFPWIAITYYAASRYRMFDIRMAFGKLLSILVVALTTASLIDLLFQYLSHFMSTTSSLFISAVIVILTVFGTEFYGRAFSILRQFLIKNSYDYNEVLEKSSELSVSLLSKDEILRRFSKLALETFQVNEVLFYIRDQDTFSLEFNQGKNLTIDLDGNSKSLVSWFEAKKKTFILEEQELSDETEPLEFKDIFSFLSPLRGELAAPVRCFDRIIGFVVFGAKRTQDSFSDGDIRLLENMLTQVGLSIENSRLFEEATTDGLTNLYHQKYFKSRLKSEYHRVVRHQDTIGLLVIDIDYFKKINDTFGHLVGDLVLKEIAGILKYSFRAEDIVARYGGEEFAVLLIKPQKDQMWEVAERLRMKISSHAFPKNIAVTVSIGLCVSDPAEEISDELHLFERADQALYHAKRTGRNRAIFWEHLQSSTGRVVSLPVPFKKIATK